MLTKFESKSNRVKGLSFHHSRPWILASLHNGVIQLWDYRMGTLLDKFEEHDGPVRGVDFHKSQPLFVSGGDDYKIKVWNYKLRRCLFTLLGHLDYIRTVRFHHEYPWILSASDDQTIRIWNWQSRTCISVLTGHNHYVMCAAFHPKDDLVVSASLDQTVRVWDTSGLRKKTVRGASNAAPGGQNSAVMNRVNQDLFGGTDAVVKYVLEGHDRGVNWASFHHTLPLIVSGADDRQVKLWRMNEVKAWEVDAMRGHVNHVSCVIFHPRQELIISNSEDRSIRVWEISKRMGMQTFRRENDRFWILAAHPDQNLLAAGHDTGMLVFKLERERPPFDCIGDQLFLVKDRFLRWVHLNSARDVPLVSVRRGSGSSSSPETLPRTLEYNRMNPAETNILVCSKADGGSYELFCLPTQDLEGAASSRGTQESKRGSGLAAVFIARNRFAVLEKNRQISIKNLENLNTKKITPPHPTTDGLFPAGTGRMLIRAEEKITLFEVQSRRVMAEIDAPRVKYAVWNDEGSHVALICKHAIVICTKDLKQLCTVTETVRVKSGAWNSAGVFFYTTLTHIKYTLINGDNGVLRTLDIPVYITKVQKNSLLCLDRECKTREIQIDPSECLFKIALMKKQYGKVMQMIRSSRFCGRAIIGYLQEKGYPEVALHFVEDKKTRFNLALECGNIEVATEAATEVDDEECWRKLGAEALRQGNHTLVEITYQKTNNFEALSFLYLITGNRRNLKKMLAVSQRFKDVMAQFHNALYLGDAPERVRILEQVGQFSLAYVTAMTHGLAEDAERIRAYLLENELPVPEVSNARALLFPPTPIQSPAPDAQGWPLLEIAKETAFANLPPASATDPFQAADASEPVSADAFAADDHFDDFDAAEPAPAEPALDAGQAWGESDDDFDLGDDDLGAPDAEARPDELDLGGDVSGVFVAPTPAADATARWCEHSTLAADHAAAGNFQEAMRLLNRQIGVVNFAPLKASFMDLYMSSRLQLPGLPSVGAMRSLLQRQEAPALPEICVKLPALREHLQTVAYARFIEAKFEEAALAFRSVLWQIPLLAVARQDARSVKDLMAVCREYLVGMLLMVQKAAVEDPARRTELSAYLTHCKLEPRHLHFPLKAAMMAAWKLNNYINAASFARRLLELPALASESQAKLRSQAKKVLVKSEQEARNTQTIDYDPSKQFTICSFDLKPLYQGTPGIVKCPYCGATAGAAYKGKLCRVCELSQLGVETIGLVCSVDSN